MMGSEKDDPGYQKYLEATYENYGRPDLVLARQGYDSAHYKDPWGGSQFIVFDPSKVEIVGLMANRKTAAQVPYVATVSFPGSDEPDVELRFTADANLDDAALHDAAQAAAEEEYYGPLTVSNIDEYDPTPLARRRAALDNANTSTVVRMRSDPSKRGTLTRNRGGKEYWFKDARGNEHGPIPADDLEELQLTRYKIPVSEFRVGDYLDWHAGEEVLSVSGIGEDGKFHWMSNHDQEYGFDSAKRPDVMRTVYRTGSRIAGHRRVAFSMWDSLTEPRHKVAGWDWDERLSGYVADAAADFACVCGSNVEAPGYCACRCGKVWNSYQITANGSTRLICREIPMRADAVLSNRETARR